MLITEILAADRRTIAAHMDELAETYRRELGRKVCRTCPSDVAYMLLSLKNHFKMVNFKFAADRAQYKIRKTDRFTISNDNLTDEHAFDFLRENPERIRLFSIYPHDWERLIYGESKIDDDSRLQALAEIEAKKIADAEAAAKAAISGESKIDDAMSVEMIDSLGKLSLQELRERYPDVKARSKEEFIRELLESK